MDDTTDVAFFPINISLLGYDIRGKCIENNNLYVNLESVNENDHLGYFYQINLDTGKITAEYRYK